MSGFFPNAERRGSEGFLFNCGGLGAGGVFTRCFGLGPGEGPMAGPLGNAPEGGEQRAGGERGAGSSRICLVLPLQREPSLTSDCNPYVTQVTIPLMNGFGHVLTQTHCNPMRFP